MITTLRELTVFCSTAGMLDQLKGDFILNVEDIFGENPPAFGSLTASINDQGPGGCYLKAPEMFWGLIKPFLFHLYLTQGSVYT